jgi:hypothetical protein
MPDTAPWCSHSAGRDIAVEARHQHIRQIIDRSYGLSSLHASDPAIADPGPEGEEKIRRTRKAERARRRRALCDVHARLHREARLAAPGILLAVAQKRIVAQIEAIGPLPRNVEWLHHGAVSGIDSFREVSRIVVVGRQAPAPSAVQACAEALTGAACTRLPARQWYRRIVARLEQANLWACNSKGPSSSLARLGQRSANAPAGLSPREASSRRRRGRRGAVPRTGPLCR